MIEGLKKAYPKTDNNEVKNSIIFSCLEEIHLAMLNSLPEDYSERY